MEYEICLYLYYNREQKIDILLNKVIPLLEKLAIKTYYFTTPRCKMKCNKKTCSSDILESPNSV